MFVWTAVSASRLPRITAVLATTMAALVAISTAARGAQLPERAKLLERILEELRTGNIDRPLLHLQQRLSLSTVFYRGADRVPMPADQEVARYRNLRERTESEALDYLDALYGSRDELEALALRDSDGDDVPDFRVSDYYGKFMEGDIDLDGDGVRNLYDVAPFDEKRGGEDDDGDGIPDSAFSDENTNGLPDHLDARIRRDEEELAAIQLGLFQDHKILLVERTARFDLPLARAVDDAVRRVFRNYFEKSDVMPTLRTIATERTALLNAVLAHIERDETSAQVFSQTQSLIIYNVGREVVDDVGLLGLLVHEMGHSYHMSQDFDIGELAKENGRTDFPSPRFVELVKPFGWTQSDYYDGDLGSGLGLVPRFVYAGMSEPVFVFKGKTPEEWGTWVETLYGELDESPTYLQDQDFTDESIVSDYALSSPYEWYGDNFIAYVVTVIEEEALKSRPGDSSAAKLEVDEALRAIWPDFYHRNIAPEVFAYFETTFPITESDRRALAERYIDPILEDN